MSHAPELNYCPQCGRPLEDKEAFGRLRRFCQACGRIVFREHKVAAGVLVWQADKVLLVQRRTGPAQGRWSFPAGFVEHDEDPAEAATRECREETGLQVEIVDLLDVIAGREHAHGADIVIVYLARPKGGTLAAGDDADEATFFTLDDLPPLAFRATQIALDRWRNACPRHP